MSRRNPQGSVRVGGYRQLDPDGTPIPTALPRNARQQERDRAKPPYSRRFHDRLTQLRSALWNDDQPAIHRLEREVTDLCDAWDRNPTA